MKEKRLTRLLAKLSSRLAAIVMKGKIEKKREPTTYEIQTDPQKMKEYFQEQDNKSRYNKL